MLTLAPGPRLDQGHQLLHFITLAGILGWQQNQTLSHNYRVAGFDPGNEQDRGFI